MRYLVAVLLIAELSAHAQAQFTDFEDLVLDTNYVVGNSFTSNGIDFDVVDFGGSGSQINVGNVGYAAGSGTELFAGRLIGVDIQLPNGAQQISFRYGESCCHSGVEINGVLNVPADSLGLVSLDGMTVGGALLSVTSTGAPTDQGIFTATGNITSFVTGGTEFAIDDLRIVVPEPATGAMLLLGMVATAIGSWPRRRT